MAFENYLAYLYVRCSFTCCDLLHPIENRTSTSFVRQILKWYKNENDNFGKFRMYKVRTLKNVLQYKLLFFLQFLALFPLLSFSYFFDRTLLFTKRGRRNCKYLNFLGNNIKISLLTSPDLCH